MTTRKTRSPLFRLKVFETAGGLCHICGLKCFGKDWDVEHVIPLALGGEDTASNMKPAHKDCHAGKTKADNASWSKAKRVAAKHVGIKKRSTMPGSRDSRFKRKMDGTVVERR